MLLQLTIAVAAARAADPLAAARETMVAEEIEAAGVSDPRVLQSMRATPRHEFMPAAYRQYAYFDAALPIGERQTISPPYVVAYMTEQLRPQPTDRVLEIGTGSGYQAAVLSPLVKDVYTIEIVPALGKRAERTLKRLKYENVHVRIGDGYQGWAEHAPFDRIIVTCSPEKIPQPLVDQLAEGGQMIIPVGERYQQNLIRVTKRDGELVREPLQATLFVPMTGAAEETRETLPNPARPGIVNGTFDQLVGESRAPAGWHYLRAAEVVQDDPDAPDGPFLRFANSTPGLPSRALQGLAVDGRQASRLTLSARVRGESLGPGLDPSERAAIMITFYDARRAAIDTVVLGPWTGSFGWRDVSREIAVPLAAREANIRLGMHGGTGILGIDDVRLEAVAAKKPTP
ncbi:MAG: protein-L-isoaspartate(D-aspartate) O-methyltransferase [Planctomycetales bacterium]|nr:protein-L-isoaspartate(D-aspartate) O-methyltransferase [Planctomycetales bacterium]